MNKQYALGAIAVLQNTHRHITWYVSLIYDTGLWVIVGYTDNAHNFTLASSDNLEQWLLDNTVSSH